MEIRALSVKSKQQKQKQLNWPVITPLLCGSVMNFIQENASYKEVMKVFRWFNNACAELLFYMYRQRFTNQSAQSTWCFEAPSSPSSLLISSSALPLVHLFCSSLYFFLDFWTPPFPPRSSLSVIPRFQMTISRDLFTQMKGKNESFMRKILSLSLLLLSLSSCRRLCCTLL